MTPHLTTRSGPVKAARRLTRRPQRFERRMFLAEGGKSLLEALAIPGCVVEVFATPTASVEYAELRARSHVEGIVWHEATDEAVSSLSSTVSPQGVVAVCRFLEVPLGRALSGETVVVCADIRDPGNAGAVIRAADAAGASGVVLAGHSVDAYNDKTVRATVGSLFHLPIAIEPVPRRVMQAARTAGFTVLAADGAGEVDLFAAGDLLTGKVAWVFGNEAWGLPDDVREAADHRVSIPILGRAESLNLASAAAVCLYATAAARRLSMPVAGGTGDAGA